MDGDGGRESIYFQCWQQLPNAANGLSHRWGLHPPNCPCYIPSQHSSIKVYLLTFASAYRQNRLKSKLVMHYWTLKKKIFFLSFLSSSQIRRCQNPKKLCERIIPAVYSKRGWERGRKPASHQVTQASPPSWFHGAIRRAQTVCITVQSRVGSTHCMPSTSK